MAPDAAHDEYLKAVALARERRWDEARAGIERAIALGGDRAEFVRLARSLPTAADLLADAGRIEEARGEYAAMARRQPGNLRAALGSRLLLPHVYDDQEAVARARADYSRGVEWLHEHAGDFRFDGVDQALAQASWTNFFLAYQGDDDRSLQARYGDFLARLLEPVVPDLFAPRPRRVTPGPHRGDGRMRVGFASHFFVDGTVGRYFAPWITRLDRSRFEVFVYHSNERADALTQSLASSADAFRSLAGQPILARAEQVLADALDVLVYPEMGMHNVTYLMGALRLAPVQCAGWGHPDTTGHRNIDWFISCQAMETAAAPGHYRERLAFLPGIGTRYEPDRAPEGASRSRLGLPEGRTLYLVPQSLFKIHPDNDGLIAQVLARDPAGVAVMLVAPQEAVTRAFAARLQRSLANVGVTADRVRFLPRLAHDDYLRVNALCDVMLDTLHWSGGNTSLDAIACGLPIVTCPGALMRGRQSAAMLGILGVPELVARDTGQSVEIAVRLGRDAAWRQSLAARMRDGHHALFARDEPIRALESFLERAVREAPRGIAG